MRSKTSPKGRQKTRKENLSFWQRHHDSWGESQLNRKSYCREHQLNYDCFQYWYHKLNKVGQVKPSSQHDTLIPIEITSSAETLPTAALCQLNTSQGCQLLIFDSKLAADLFERLI
jgi:hypothetical protein